MIITLRRGGSSGTQVQELAAILNIQISSLRLKLAGTWYEAYSRQVGFQATIFIRPVTNFGFHTRPINLTIRLRTPQFINRSILSEPSRLLRCRPFLPNLLISAVSVARLVRQIASFPVRLVF